MKNRLSVKLHGTKISYEISNFYYEDISSLDVIAAFLHVYNGLGFRPKFKDEEETVKAIQKLLHSEVLT
jgi:hypothetical protein